MPRPRAEGYLGAKGLPDHSVPLPPPPAVGSPAGIADVAIFHATRAEAPARTLTRANADLIGIVGASKDHYLRPRPFVTETGPVCIDISPTFGASGSYPSGHSADATCPASGELVSPW